MNNNIKNRIKALESSNAKHPRNSDLNIRRAQVQIVVYTGTDTLHDADSFFYI